MSCTGLTGCSGCELQYFQTGVFGMYPWGYVMYNIIPVDGDCRCDPTGMGPSGQTGKCEGCQNCHAWIAASVGLNDPCWSAGITHWDWDTNPSAYLTPVNGSGQCPPTGAVRQIGITGYYPGGSKNYMYPKCNGNHSYYNHQIIIEIQPGACDGFECTPTTGSKMISKLTLWCGECTGSCP